MIDYESLSELIHQRRTIRVYDPAKHLTWEQLLKIIEAGIWAPTGSNQQELRFMIITDPEAIRKVLTKIDSIHFWR